MLVPEIREADGFINATALCKAAGVKWADYWRNKTTKAFVEALAVEMRTRTSELAQVSKGGSSRGGTWLHPRVFPHFENWLQERIRSRAAVSAPKVVYLFHDRQAGRVKIGCTTDIAGRKAAVEYAVGGELDVIGLVAGDEVKEQELHRRFAHLHLKGEWFRAALELWVFALDEAYDFVPALPCPQRRPVFALVA